RSRPRHSGPRSGETSALRLARLAANLGNGIIQRTPIEESWFQSVFAGGELSEPWASAPFDDYDDWEFNTASGDRISDLIELYEAACEKSRQVVGGADSLDQLSAKDTRHGRVSLRWILIHMIEETARHAGHADLIRERIDGSTGI
ncbi:MAG: DUF664 domain-containing protein, partial [Acidimicrobiia bacterium]